MKSNFFWSCPFVASRHSIRGFHFLGCEQQQSLLRRNQWRSPLNLQAKRTTDTEMKRKIVWWKMMKTYENKNSRNYCIHPASRGGPPTPPVFWFGPCKDIEHTSTNCLQYFLIVFLQHPCNLYIFGHKVGPKHRFLQCCFNLFFKSNIIYAFFNIKLVQNTGFCSVFNTLTSQIL